jgi:hypothetical protein
MGARNRPSFFYDCASRAWAHCLAVVGFDLTVLEKLETMMETGPITLTQAIDGRWVVGNGRRMMPTMAFSKRPHALSFARALAYSMRASLYVAGETRRLRKQAPETLTYPSSLC